MQTMESMGDVVYSPRLRLPTTGETDGSCQPIQLSMDFIQTVFGYQRDIIDIQHKQELQASKERNPVIIENRELRLTKQRKMEIIHEMKMKLITAKEKLNANEIKLRELKQLSGVLVDCTRPSCPRRIPHDVIFKCIKEVKLYDSANPSETHPL